MEASFTISIVAQISVLLTCLAATLLGERISKSTWGYALWLVSTLFLVPLGYTLLENIAGLAFCSVLLSLGVFGETVFRRRRNRMNS